MYHGLFEGSKDFFIVNLFLFLFIHNIAAGTCCANDRRWGRISIIRKMPVVLVPSKPES